MARSDLILLLSWGPRFPEPGLRSLGVKLLWERCTPVVCTGVELAPPPKSSLRPPSADKLDRALRAPGFESSWASGIALAKGEAVEEGPLVLEPGAEPPWAPGVAGFWASRLAFCSSTLLDKEQRDRHRVR